MINTINQINTDKMENTDKKAERHNLLMEFQTHHFARLAMMQAEERGVDLSYEDAIRNQN